MDTGGHITWRVEQKIAAQKPALHGRYLVKDFYFNGSKDVTPGDTVVWRSLQIEYNGYARAILLSDHAIDFTLRVDTAQRTFHLRTPYDQYLLTYRQDKNGNLNLWGPRLERDSVRIKLERVVKKNESILLNNKFHWIKEYAEK